MFLEEKGPKILSINVLKQKDCQKLSVNEISFILKISVNSLNEIHLPAKRFIPSKLFFCHTVAIVFKPLKTRVKFGISEYVK